MLLATRNPVIKVEEQPSRGAGDVQGPRVGRSRASDCVLLPIENTTAELIARYIAGRLADALRTRHSFTPTVLRVEVEENVGQSATYEWRPG